MIIDIALMSLAMQLAGGAEGPSLSADLAPACIGCHSQQTDDEELVAPAEAFLTDDIHAARGFGCHDCHGGNPNADVDDDDAAHDDDEYGFIGLPEPADVPGVCSRCHSDIDIMRVFDPRARVDQLDEYRTSVHGKLLAEGDDNVATCVSCHGAHGVRAVDSPLAPVYPPNVAETCGQCHSDTDRMADYGIPTDQVSAWQRGVHGHALEAGDNSAPTCNDCHGNHGATPPGAQSVVFVCGQCHVREATLFRSSPLKEPWDALGLPECIKCHGNHEVLPPSDQMVGADSDAVCSQCHEHGAEGLGVASAVRASYEELGEAIGGAETILAEAGRKGMHVSEDLYALAGARDSLVEARVLLHSFDQAVVRERVDEGLAVAAEATEAGHSALKQIEYRRRGLAVALVFILAAIARLWLWIREIEADA